MPRGYGDERGYRERDSPDRRGPPSRGPPFRGGGRRDDREDRTSLLVRNIPRDTRPDELRIPFERYGPIKDVYLPRDYYTGEPRGFGFVQFLSPEDAEDAQYELDRTVFQGREITVVFAEENRKKPDEMRQRERYGSPGPERAGAGPGPGYGRRRSPPGRYYSQRSPDYSPSPPRRRSPSPRRRGRSPPPPPPGDDGFYGHGRAPPRDRERDRPPYHAEYEARGPADRGPPLRAPPRSLGPDAGPGSLVPPGYEEDEY